MSDERPKNEDEFNEPDGTPESNPNGDSASPEQPELDGLNVERSDAKPETEPSEGLEADEGSEAEQKAGEAFRETFDRDPADDNYDDDYYDYDEDYDLDERAEPAPPKSAAHRVLTRSRVENEPDGEMSDDQESEGMSFLEHLEEFRWTVARSALAFIVGVIVVVVFHKDIAQMIQLPLHKAYGSAEVARDNLITYKAMGVISVFFQIALLGGLTLSMPFMLYFLGSFIAPGLTEKEQKLLRPSCFAAFALFLTGVAFAFFIILPLALGFTVRLNQHLGFDIFWAASDYYNMVVWFSLAIGAFFQFPLIVVLLVYIGILATQTLKQVRRAVFVGLMVFSALVSPGGDPVSLTVTTGFMYGLYELAVWVGTRIEAKKLEEEEAKAWPDGPPDEDV